MKADSFTLIATRNEFDAAVRAAIHFAAEVDAHEMVFIDPHFADWPLNDRDVVETLGRWVNSQRKLVVFAGAFEEMARRQLRFVEWRRQWAHVVQCRNDDEVEAEQVPTLLLVRGHLCVRLVDRVRFRGSISTQAGDLVVGQEAADALLQRSVEAFPVTTLGL
ncbi:MAG: hypothetical protein ABI641_15920 [Caldimonas sp.]